MAALERLQRELPAVVLEAEALPAARPAADVRTQVPSASSVHELASSRSASSRIRTRRRWIAGSTTGTTASTRRSRLRSIMSGDPNQIRSGRPWSPPKRNRRECSRNRPTIDRTRMCSDSPGTPGRMPHRPRTTRSTGHPAADAR